jgi:hypothetical protein
MVAHHGILNEWKWMGAESELGVEGEGADSEGGESEG